MPRKKNPHSVKGLVDVRGRLAPTVGFRDYVFSKKPSVKRTANEMVRSISDYLFSEIGPGASGSTFGLDDRLTVPDISEGIKRENLNRVEGEERGVFGRRITLWEKDKILLFLDQRQKDLFRNVLNVEINHSLFCLQFLQEPIQLY